MNYIKEMRIRHYIKNLIIFMPSFFAGNLFNLSTLKATFLSFLAFCMMSSAVYVFNDLKDVEKDRLHPIKSQRPIASGKIGKKQAVIFGIILIVFSLILICIASSSRGPLMVIVLLYLGINLSYSVGGAKNYALLDVALLVSGFYLRLLMGSQISHIELSNWFSLVVISGAFFLAFGKRRNEMRQNGSKTRSVLQSYNQTFLDKAMYCSMTLALAFFASWCQEKAGSYIILFPLMMLFFLRYSLDIEIEEEGDPITIIFKDRLLLVLLAVIGGLTFFLVYY